MKTIITSTLAAILAIAALSSCSSTDKTKDNSADTVGFYHQSTMPRR